MTERVPDPTQSGTIREGYERGPDGRWRWRPMALRQEAERITAAVRSWPVGMQRAASFAAPNHVESGDHKSAPRDGNLRGHGTGSEVPMQSEHIARETTRVVRHLLHEARLTGSLSDTVERWTDNGQMRVGGSGIYVDAYEAFFDSPDGRYGLSVVVRICDRKGTDGSA